MGDKEDRIKNLEGIKNAALGFVEDLNSDDPVTAQASMRGYVALVDRFYQDSEHLMAPLQSRAAREDFEYFVRLLDLAIQYAATSDPRQ